MQQFAYMCETIETHSVYLIDLELYEWHILLTTYMCAVISFVVVHTRCSWLRYILKKTLLMEKSCWKLANWTWWAFVCVFAILDCLQFYTVQKKTHSHFLLYLPGKCLDLCKIFRECLRWRKYSIDVKVKYCYRWRNSDVIFTCL